MEKNPEISIVIPLFNENESLKELIQTTQNVMDIHNYDYEIIFIDDGSLTNHGSQLKKYQKNIKIYLVYPFQKIMVNLKLYMLVLKKLKAISFLP